MCVCVCVGAMHFRIAVSNPASKEKEKGTLISIENEAISGRGLGQASCHPLSAWLRMLTSCPKAVSQTLTDGIIMFQ